MKSRHRELLNTKRCLFVEKLQRSFTFANGYGVETRLEGRHWSDWIGPVWAQLSGCDGTDRIKLNRNVITERA